MSIVQVARLAGVSNATVSRVINKNPTVQADIVKSVEAAMAELRYTPSPRRRRGSIARNLPEQKAVVTMLVLSLSADHTPPAFTDLMHGLFDGAKHWGVKLLLQSVTDAERLSEQLAGMPFDGLLLHGEPPSPEVAKKLRSFPTVWLMPGRWQPEWGDQIMPDLYEIGDRAARYLLSRGHRRLAFVNLDSADWSIHLARGSFAAAAAAAGASVDLLEEGIEDPAQERHEINAASLAEKFAKLRHRPTGLFVANDMQLAVIQPALQNAGIEFGPGKLEVVSCNNERAYLAGLSPVPAEIGICADVIGFRAVEQLLWRLKNVDVPERFLTCVEPALFDPAGRPVVLPTASTSAA